MKLIRQKYLQTQISAIEAKKSKSRADLTTLAKLQKELVPIAKFLSEARQQRDAILLEIGICIIILICLFIYTSLLRSFLKMFTI